MDGILSYGGSDDMDPGYELADLSYQEAGVNPGAGLNLALQILQAAGPTRNEPTVLLVTTGKPKGGPDVDPSANADEIYEEATIDAAYALEAAGVNLHVVSIVPNGGVDEDFLSTMTVGRGLFRSSDDAAYATELLDDVARDIKIQMVQ